MVCLEAGGLLLGGAANFICPDLIFCFHTPSKNRITYCIPFCCRSSLTGNQSDDFSSSPSQGRFINSWEPKISFTGCHPYANERKTTFPMGSFGAGTMKWTTLLQLNYLDVSCVERFPTEPNYSAHIPGFGEHILHFIRCAGL